MTCNIWELQAEHYLQSNYNKLSIYDIDHSIGEETSFDMSFICCLQLVEKVDEVSSWNRIIFPRTFTIYLQVNPAT